MMKKVPKPKKSERVFAFIDRPKLFDEIIKVTETFPCHFYVMAYTIDTPNLAHLRFYIFRLQRPSKYGTDTVTLNTLLAPLGGILLDDESRNLSTLEKIFAQIKQGE